MVAGSGMFSDKSPYKRHLTEGKGGVAGEVDDLRSDIGKAFAQVGLLSINHYDFPPAADVDAYITAGASATTAVEYTDDDFDGVEALVVTSTVDLDDLVYGAGGCVDGETVYLRVGKSGDLQSVTIAAPANKAALVTQLDAFTGVTAALDGNDRLTLTSATLPIYIVRGTSDVLEKLGLALGMGVMTAPRQFSVTTSDSAGTWTGNFTVWGFDAQGKQISDTKAMANNTTITTDKFFLRVTKVTVDGQNDALGTYTGGFAAPLGLYAPPVIRSGLVIMLHELETGVAPAGAGTLAKPLAAPPYGSYTPAIAVSGSDWYLAGYEMDAS